MIGYPYIRAWGVCLRSSNSYVQWEVDRAWLTDAPRDAVYSDGDRWVTLGECCPRVQRELKEMVNDT